MSEGGPRIPLLGEMLAGKYRLIQLLGEGGMGVVFGAEHVRLRQSLAIKFLNPEMLGLPDIVTRFEREARAAATLKSRHVVRVTDVEQTPDGIPYMVMELLVGADLESERTRRGRLGYAEAVDYVLQACGALAEAHTAGIVHRDLKPANLFLAREQDGTDRSIVKVLDFGISKFLQGDDAKLTSAGAVMGTALYMSPEQVRGGAEIDGRADIWSLGVILYELISGEAPWQGPPTRVAACVVSEPAPDIRASASLPEPLAATIHAMLEKDRSKRLATIADVALALAPFAPPGSVGADVAETVARRSNRMTPVDPARVVVAPLESGPLSGPLSGVPAGAVAVSGPGVSGTPRQPRSTPERSTMNATTSNVKRTPPRLWGAFAGLGALALAGAALIAFAVLRRPSPAPPSAPAAPASAPEAVTAASTASSVAAVPPSAATSVLASASAYVPPPAPEVSVGAPPRPTRPAVAPIRHPNTPSSAAPPARASASAPTVNPAFLN